MGLRNVGMVANDASETTIGTEENADDNVWLLQKVPGIMARVDPGVPVFSMNFSSKMEPPIGL